MTADAPTTDAPTTDAPTDEPTDSPTDRPTDQPSGDIAAMERALKKANREAEAARRKLKDREDADLSETEKVLEKAREEARADERAKVLGEANNRILRAEVKALAAGRVVDPDVAVALLDLSDFDVDDSGNVDRKAVEKALDALVAAKPYLSVGNAGRTPSVPTGARTAASGSGDDMNARLRRAAGY